MGYTFDDERFEVFASNLVPIATTGLDANRDEVDALILAVLKGFGVFLEFGLCGCVTFGGCRANDDNDDDDDDDDMMIAAVY